MEGSSQNKENSFEQNTFNRTKITETKIILFQKINKQVKDKVVLIFGTCEHAQNQSLTFFYVI